MKKIKLPKGNKVKKNNSTKAKKTKTTKKHFPIKKYKYILAMDQASNKSGFSVYNIEDLYNPILLKHGVFDIEDIKEDKYGESYFDEKIKNVKMFLIKLIKEYNIEFVILEDVQKQINIKTFKYLAGLLFVLRDYLYENNISYTVKSPSEWRKYIPQIKGRKREEVKASAIKYVTDKYGFIPQEDEAESICIGEALIKSFIKQDIEIYLEDYFNWL